MNERTTWDQFAFFVAVAIVPFTTLAYGTVHQPVIATFYLLITITSALFIIGCLRSGCAAFSLSRLQLPLVLLAVYALVQSIPFGTVAEAGGLASIAKALSVDPSASKVTGIHMLFLSAYFAFMLSFLDSAGRIKRLVGFLTIFGFVYAFYAILQMVLSPDKIYGIYKPATATPFGSFVNRHDFAAVIEMLIALPIAAVFSGTVKPDKKLLYLVAIFLMGAALLLSGSRGGLVALAAEMLLLVLLTSRFGSRQLWIKAALAVALIGGSIAGAVFVGGDTSLTRFGDPAGAEEISSSRFEIWSNTAKLAVKHLPFGSGLGAFGQAYTSVDSGSGVYRIEQAHNDYLQIVADAGVVGIVLGGLFLFWFFRDGLKNTRTTDPTMRTVAVGAFVGCFGILVHSAFDFVLHITAVSVMFLAFLALLVASGRQFGENTYDEPESRHHKASVTPIRPRS